MRLSEIGYKTLIIAGALAVFALPALASGVIFNNFPLYTHDNLLTSSSVSFTAAATSTSQTLLVNVGNFGEATSTILSIGLQSCGASVLLSSKPNTINCNFTLNAGQNYTLTATANSINPFARLDVGLTAANDLVVSITDTSPVPVSATFKTPTSTAAAILTNISDQLGDEGFLTFAILSAGLILGFWGMEKFLEMTPK